MLRKLNNQRKYDILHLVHGGTKSTVNLAVTLFHEPLDVLDPITEFPPSLGKNLGSEDCLQLSVYAPGFEPAAVPTANDRLPVMVWIHGGANITGKSATYDWGRFAAKHGVVVAAVNYRLGAFGWSQGIERALQASSSFVNSGRASA